MEYSEHIAQANIQAGAQNKGRRMRFTNAMARLLAIKIKAKRKSPAHARKKLRDPPRSNEEVLSSTTDNGCEFLDARRMETLFSRINALVKVYSATSRSTPF